MIKCVITNVPPSTQPGWFWFGGLEAETCSESIKLSAVKMKLHSALF